MSASTKKAKPATIEPLPLAIPDEHRALGLRSVDKDHRAYGGFQWPKNVGDECAAPDWNPEPVCGGGLHLIPDGWGNWGLMSFEVGSVYQVTEYDKREAVLVDGEKVKVPRCRLVYVGDLGGAMGLIVPHQVAIALKTADAKVAEGDQAVAASSGNSSKAASSGYSSKAASSGDYSTAASSGYSSKAASSGNSSTAASSGDYSTAASSGDYSTAASSGYSSTAASSGYSSKAASSGDYSTAASSGNYSKAASSGYSSTAASSGNSSTAASSGNSSKASAEGDCTVAMVAGSGGRAKAGPNGAFALAWKDGTRMRIAVGEVGVDGIEADTWYCVDGDGKVVPA